MRAVCFFSCKNQTILSFCPLKIGIEVSTKLSIAIDTDTQSPGIGSIDSWYRYHPPLRNTASIIFDSHIPQCNLLKVETFEYLIPEIRQVFFQVFLSSQTPSCKVYFWRDIGISSKCYWKQA